MPGGNPGCGDVITVYLKLTRMGSRSRTSPGKARAARSRRRAASILMEMVHDEDWSMEDILDHDYTTMIDILGKEAVQMRPKCATLALGTLKAAVRKYQRDQLRARAWHRCRYGAAARVSRAPVGSCSAKRPSRSVRTPALAITILQSFPYTSKVGFGRLANSARRSAPRNCNVCVGGPALYSTQSSA